jgi:flagellar basal-body rod protein FlgC
MQGVFAGFDIARSGMQVEMRRAEAVAANIGNMHVTSGPHGSPYRRRVVVVEEVPPAGAFAPELAVAQTTAELGGVKTTAVVEDHATPFVPRFDPGHPHADENGFVLMSNVDVFREMVDMAVIQRSFEANVATLRTYRGMLQSALASMRP